MERNVVSLREIISIRNQSFVEESAQKVYVTRRGLYRETVPREGSKMRESGYVDMLPLVDGKPVDEVIDEIVTEKGSARILDVGCGEGKFLKDCVQMWGDGVEAFGISAFSYDSTEEENDQNVTIGVGDAQSLLRTLKRNGMPTEGYDLVVSVMMTPYIQDEIALIKQINRVLSQSGTALISPSTSGHYLDLTSDQFNTSHRGLWFKKILPRLTFPDIKYEIWESRGEKRISHIGSFLDIMDKQKAAKARLNA